MDKQTDRRGDWRIHRPNLLGGSNTASVFNSIVYNVHVILHRIDVNSGLQLRIQLIIHIG